MKAKPNKTKQATREGCAPLQYETLDELITRFPELTPEERQKLRAFECCKPKLKGLISDKITFIGLPQFNG